MVVFCSYMEERWLLEGRQTAIRSEGPGPVEDVCLGESVQVLE